MHRPSAAASAPARRLAPATTGLSVAGAALCATALLCCVLLPAPVALLATACALVVAGFGVAAALLLAGRRMGRDGTAGWDAASAMVLLGFAAALLTDTGEALTALAELRSR